MARRSSARRRSSRRTSSRGRLWLASAPLCTLFLRANARSAASTSLHGCSFARTCSQLHRHVQERQVIA
eukprot:835694-Prymnesium_polylepis.1